MFKKIQQGVVILGLLLPLATQAQPCRGMSADGSSLATCDMIFINPPLFGTLCQNSSEIGTYTLQNNTPVTLNINYIRIQSSDGFPAGDSSIVPSPVNSCGSSLAPGATCEISVQLQSLTALGTFNRVLQVGINSRQVQLTAPAITATVAACTIPPPTPPAGFTPTIPGVPLVLFQSSILAYSTITNTGPTLVNGDLDLTPGSAVIGFPPGAVVNGVVNINNTAATTIRTIASSYFTALNGLPCDHSFAVPTDINNALIASGPGVYCFSSSASITTNVNLAGVAGQSYVFKIGSTLTVANGTIMTTSGGILNDNINWAIGSSATLGTNSTIFGIIDALASITLPTGAALNGRAWALNGAVTLDSNQVNPAAV